MGNYVINGKVNLGEQYNLSEAIKEIAGLLNVNPRSDGKYYLSDICMADNINKWSRCKPIEYPSTGPLTSEQRKGSADQQADGIFYGIKINGNLAPTINASLAQVHDVTFEYIRPTGWKRLRDFDGYVQGAEASPSYNMDNEGTWDDVTDTYGGIAGITIFYSTTGSGVNLIDRLVGVSAETTLKKAFPAIVVTKVATGQSYMTALFEQGTTTAYPLMNALGVVTNRIYHCKMSKPVYSTAILQPMPPPFTSAEVVRVSVILVESASVSQPLLSPSGPNFADNWISLTGSIAATAKPFVMAGENGMTITLKDRFKGVKFIPNKVDMLGRTITIGYKEVTGESSSNQITLTARVTITKITSANGKSISTSGAGGTTTRTINGWSAGQTMVGLLIKQSAIPQSGEVWEGYATITTKDGTNESQTSERYYFTKNI